MKHEINPTWTSHFLDIDSESNTNNSETGYHHHLKITTIHVVILKKPLFFSLKNDNISNSKLSHTQSTDLQAIENIKLHHR